jgi:hypothetical protein
MIKGKHPIPAMQELADKHGIESFTFEVLEVSPNPWSSEREWIEKLQPTLNRTGTKKVRAMRQAEWTPERRKAHSESVKNGWALQRAGPELWRQQQMTKAIEDAIATLEQRVDFLGDGHRQRLEALSRREVLE